MTVGFELVFNSILNRVECWKVGKPFSVRFDRAHFSHPAHRVRRDLRRGAPLRAIGCGCVGSGTRHSSGLMASSTTPSSAPPPPGTLAAMRRARLSVSQANAITNFDLLLSDMRNRRLVVFLDYDGTLTPIVSDPASAHMSVEMRTTLQRLRERFVTGVISGRSLSKIQQFVSIPELYYAGSHGFDIVGPNGTAIKNQVAVDFLAHLEQIRDALMKAISDIPGAAVEDNVYSVSLHYRNVAPELQARTAAIAHETLSQHPQIKCNEGKMVYEFKPKIDWNKGKALVWLLQALGLDAVDDVFTIYIGDDTTDEDAFDVFRGRDNRRGVGIVVTDQSKPTGAFFTLHDTNEVFQFLNKLVDLDQDATQRSSTSSSTASSSTSTDR